MLGEAIISFIATMFILALMFFEWTFNRFIIFCIMCFAMVLVIVLLMYFGVVV